jgi:AcrR family transcriptional regulator
VEVEERIVRAATLSFARDGLIAARVEDIREEAGVSVGAVYHHFADKQALHTAAWLRSLEDYQGAFLAAVLDSESAEDGVRSAVGAHLKWVAKNRDAAVLLRSGRPRGAGDLAQVSAQNHAFFVQVLRWWRLHVSYGRLRDLEVEVLNALWVGPVSEYCRIWLDGDKSTIPKRVEIALADAAWGTLKGPTPL